MCSETEVFAAASVEGGDDVPFARPPGNEVQVENRRQVVWLVVGGGGGGGDQPDAFGGRGDRAENGDRFEAAGGGRPRCAGRAVGEEYGVEKCCLGCLSISW